MTRVLKALAIVAVFALSMAPATAAPTGSVTSADRAGSCFAGSGGTCAAESAATPDGDFSASAELTSPDSPFTGGSRYATSLARYTIGFDLPAPTREAVITADLHVEEASASWTQTGTEIFGGDNSPSSSARVLFQLFGDEAPDGCFCGWPQQGASDVTVVRAAAPGESTSISGTDVQLVMTARHFTEGKLLPAGHYELLLRGYALANLVGSGDWGTLTADMSGRIENISVSIPAAESNLTLTVVKEGSARTLSAVLTDPASALGIEGRTITFASGGETLGTAVTDANGSATLPLEGRYRAGNLLFTADFAGDETYLPSSAEADS